MMRDRELLLKFRVGVFVLFLLLLFIAFVLTIGIQTRLFEEQYTLRAAFRDVQGLVVGAPVRLAGLTVGTVRKIGFGPGPTDPRIHVEAAIDRLFQSRIREDSLATIGTIGLVGDKVFDITVGSEGAKILQPGEMLQSMEPVDFARLVAQAGEVLEGLAGASQALRTILARIETGRGLLPALVSDQEGGELLRDLAEAAKSLRRLSEGAEKGDGLLHALVFEEGGRELVAQIRATGAGLQHVVGRLQAKEGLLGALISDPEGAQVLQDLRTMVADLKQIAAALAEGEGTLGALLKDPTVYEDLSSLLRGAERSWVLRGLIRSGVRGGRDAIPEEKR
jgi:phospholipid/cholesterol/gamma-HCH transport system substrate-binding protein